MRKPRRRVAAHVTRPGVLAMNARIPKSITRAAAARARGSSWDVAAQEAGWPKHDLQGWITRHKLQWHRALNLARWEARDAACDEAVSVLRVQLREDAV